MDSKPRIKLPASAAKGDVIEIKTLVQHPMESGQRRDAAGATVPRKILNRMTCAFNGKPVFEAKMRTAVSANPYMSFFAKVTESGTFEFAWTDDDGSVTTEKVDIKVA